MKWHKSQKDTLYAITQYACLTKYLYLNNVQEHSYILSMHTDMCTCIFVASILPASYRGWQPLKRLANF